MCFVHVKCSSKCSAKNFIDSSLSPIKFILKLFAQRQLFPNVYLLFGGLNMHTLDLLTFKDFRHACKMHAFMRTWYPSYYDSSRSDNIKSIKHHWLKNHKLKRLLPQPHRHDYQLRHSKKSPLPPVKTNSLYKLPVVAIILSSQTMVCAVFVNSG